MGHLRSPVCPIYTHAGRGMTVVGEDYTVKRENLNHHRLLIFQ
jgi:hypothetical protein